MKGLATWLVCLGLVACTKAQVLAPDAAALLATESAKAKAATEAVERERQAAAERALERQAALAAEFEALANAHVALVSQLQRWDAAGDGRANPVAETVAAWPKLATLLPAVESCELRLRELADKPLHPKVAPQLAGRVRHWCDLVRRAVPIVQRQVVAAARPFLTTNHWVREIPKRYADHGRVNWHEWLQLRAAEQLWEELAPPHLAAAKAVGAALPRDDMLRPAVEARARLQREVEHGLSRLTLPAGIDDPAFARTVTGLWKAGNWPASSLRGEVLAVRAVDAAWLPLRDATRQVTRQMREGAVLLQAVAPDWAVGCWVQWVHVERKGGRDRLLRTDDVRKVRCPGASGSPGAVKT